MLAVEVRAGEGGGSRWSWEWRPRGGLSEPTLNCSVVDSVGKGLRKGWER